LGEINLFLTENS